MTEKLRVYLYFDEAVAMAARPTDAKCGRPALKHKVILAPGEEQAQPVSLLITKFCDKYNAQAGLPEGHRLDPAEMQLRLGSDGSGALLKPAAQPITSYVSDYNDVHVVFQPAAPPAVQHEAGSVACTNFGCGKRFVPGRDDGEGSCVHHAGRPVFHDTYKFWSCCPDRKMLEFADFEKLPGCAVGVHRHDPVSSAIAVAGSGGGSATLDRKPLTAEELRAIEEKNKPAAVAAAAAAATVSSDSAVATADMPAPVRGPREFTGSASSSAAAASAQPAKPDAEGYYRCRRYGCQKKFKPEENGPTACSYHPQGPVFHDTYKYWMCCPKNKCSDFADFEKVPGCMTGEHAA